MALFNFNALNVNSLECVSMNNQECKARLKIIDAYIITILLLEFISEVENFTIRHF